MGGPAGFSYRLPKLGTPRADHDALCIAEGRVEEHQIRPGVTLVVSDLQVHHHYEATSFMTPRFSAIIMLQGRARSSTAKTTCRWSPIVASAPCMATAHA